MSESKFFEVVALVDALNVFRQHAWRYKGLLIANYSGVAASMNKMYHRDSGKPFEYVNPFAKFGFVMQYANSELSNQAVPYFIMDELAFMELEQSNGICLDRVKKSYDRYSFSFFDTRSAAKNARKMEARKAITRTTRADENISNKTKIMCRAALEKCKRMTPEEFYHSWEWLRLRYEILKKYGPKCMVCGATPKDGAKICVDHIKSRALFPDYQLDPDNLQILCDECNRGKSRRDKTDWR